VVQYRHDIKTHGACAGLGPALDTEIAIDQPVDQHHEVKAAERECQEVLRVREPVMAEFERAARAASREIDEVASDPQQTRASVLERALAAAKLPEVRAQAMVLEARKLDAEQRLSEVRASVKQRLTSARRQSPERRALMQELFRVLDDAGALVEQIGAFDSETLRLGGGAGDPVFAELSPSNPDNLIEFRRRRWKEVGEL
jgi:hypothetical protein